MASSLPINQIVCGSALEVLKTFPDESVNCCISSPPYWALRDYGVDGQLGLEPTFEEYIDKLCTIYDEVRRVLRKDGTCWVNLGDTYSNTSCGGGSPVGERKGRANCAEAQNKRKFRMNLPEKCLCLIPQRFAIEMVNRGWILRNCLIWHKPNPMPSSAKDRFTVDFEYVYFFVKRKRYFFEPQYEPQSRESLQRYNYGFNTNNMKPSGERPNTNETVKPNPLGRNKRTVWTIPTQPFSEAHFATFPEKLVEPMILSGCPAFVCTKCGKPRVKILEDVGEKTWTDTRANQSADSVNVGTRGLAFGRSSQIEFKGYTDCGCGAKFRPGIVLDMFAGSGTVGQVAARLRRDYVLIELKQEYIKMAKRRIATAETGVSVKEAKAGQMALFDGKDG